MKKTLLLTTVIFLGCQQNNSKLDLSQLPHTSTNIYSSYDFNSHKECKYVESGIKLKDDISQLWANEEIRMGIANEKRIHLQPNMFYLI